MAGLAAVASALAACSSTPAVCTDLDSVQATVHRMQNLQVGQNTVSDLQHELQTLNKQLHQLAAHASQQYAREIGAVKSSLHTLQSDLSAAVAQPSAASVSALQQDLGRVKSALKNLSSAVSTTC